MSKKVINQITATMSVGDAISNEVLAIKRILDNMGIENNIYAENIHPKLKKYVNNYREYKGNRDHILINHFGIGSAVNDYVIKLRNTIKIIRYHNITPSSFFEGYNLVTSRLCNLGREQLKNSKEIYTYSLAVSEYNKEELINLGYNNITVIPIIMELDDYKKKPDDNIIKKSKKDIKNIVFVGRVSPNKKQEDIVKSFYYYNKYFNNNSRLFIVGNYEGMERYYKQLNDLVCTLNLEKYVKFTGHIRFEEILGYYSIADLFLCMSEHEGFCVPLVESMYFKVPIIAYDSSAISFSLDGSSILVKEKDYKYIAGMMDYILENDKLREQIVSKQLNRLEQLKPERIEIEMKEYLKNILGEM